MRLFLSAIAICALAGCVGCASNPAGSNWALADFNKYDRNYQPFPIQRLRIGMAKNEVLALLPAGANVSLMSAGSGGETYTAERWHAVAGPDYLDERLV